LRAPPARAVDAAQPAAGCASRCGATGGAPSPRVSPERTVLDRVRFRARLERERTEG